MNSFAFRLALFASIGFVLGGCAGLPLAPAPSKQLAATEGEVDLDAARRIISNYRIAHGLSPVTLDPTLQRVAQRQAMAMAKADLMSHTVEGNLKTRLDGGGIPYKEANENISAGYGTLASAIQGWQTSPPHNANLLDPKVRRIGIADADAPKSRYIRFWALDMTD
jgi:uncharacterized protein YkwD